MVEWIWAGCAMMALGGLLALSDRRYRMQKRRKKERDLKLNEALS
jgi:cytochrome c-type biogenesis protein CcmF